MFSEPLLNFCAVIVSQFFLLVVHAVVEGKLRLLPRYLLEGACIGIFFGIAFDLIFGKMLGIFSYVLGFSLPFLALNGALSYGCMLANTLLMRDARLVHFYVWSVVVGVVYEGANMIFPVWSWDFALSNWDFVSVIGAGYGGLAFMLAVTARVVLYSDFHLIDYVWSRHHFRFGSSQK